MKRTALFLTQKEFQRVIKNRAEKTTDVARYARSSRPCISPPSLQMGDIRRILEGSLLNFEGTRRLCTTQRLLPSSRVSYITRLGRPAYLQVVFSPAIYFDRNDIYPLLESETSSNSNLSPFPDKRLSALGWFILFDTPLLVYLNASKIEQNLRFPKSEYFPSPQLRTPYDEAHYALLANYYSKHTKTVPSFSLKFKPINHTQRLYKILGPTFCQNGRLWAYTKFLAGKRRAHLVNTITYQLRAVRGGLVQYEFDKTRTAPDITLPDFSKEDAWYYEMCTGLSLSAEIAAILYEVQQITPVSPAWQEIRINIFLDILERYRTVITTCPAVFWRYSVIRNIFRQIDLSFRYYEYQSDENLVLLIDKVKNPDAEYTLENYAFSLFDLLFEQELDAISICTARVQGFQNTAPRDFIKWAMAWYPMDFLYSDTFSKDFSLDNFSKIKTVAEEVVDNASTQNTSKDYFRYCNKKHAYIMDLLSKQALTLPSNQKLELVNASELEKLFYSVRERLYPNGYIELDI